MWKDKLKEKSVEIVLGLLVISLPILFANSIVDQYITPKVTATLEQSGYLRQDIKAGQYVTTDEMAFADNQRLSAAVLKQLNNQGYARSSELTAVSQQLGQLQQQLAQQASSAARVQQQAQQEIRQLNEVIQALTSGKIDVTLFVSNLESDRGYVVLNINNRAISDLLENNERYTLEHGDGERLRLKARIEPTPASNYTTDAAIGRLHREDYHELFSGTRSGARVARIVID